MPLSYEHQLSLLKDLLNNQSADCCGSVAECEQMERLIKSLMVNMDISPDVKVILEDVYDYSQTGIGTRDLDSHILANQEQLSQWADGIGRLS